jgi:hypothetical protein
MWWRHDAYLKCDVRAYDPVLNAFPDADEGGLSLRESARLFLWSGWQVRNGNEKPAVNGFKRIVRAI